MIQTLTAREAEIINTLYEQNRNLAEGTDDERRALTKKMAEQFVFEFGPLWGTKSAGVGRPPSKDAIAYQDGIELYGFDWQNGSTRRPQVREGSVGMNITGQVFIPVDPVNHLGTPMPQTTGNEQVVRVLEDISNFQRIELKTMLSNIYNMLTELNMSIDRLRQEVNKKKFSLF